MASKKPASKADRDLLKEARDRFAQSEKREDDNIRRAKEAINFRALNQWPDAIKRDRENPNQVGGARPCPVMDKTNQYVRRVVNDIRRNVPAIRFRPADDSAHPEVAAIYDGIARRIQNDCEAKTIYATAVEQAVDGGYGYWRLITEYVDARSFDQKIVIKGVANRFTVLLGPHDQPDGSDATYGFVYEDIPLDEFKSRYPKKQPKSWEDAKKDFGPAGWMSDESVRVAEYIRIVEEPCEIVQCMVDGELQALDADDYDALVKQAQTDGIEPPEEISRRTSKEKCVKWSKITATDVLEEGELVGTYLGIVKVTGNDLVLPDGKHKLSGLIESAMDPQRLHNYSTAKFIESVALSPLAPYTAAAGQTEKHPEWQDANRVPFAVLPYDPVDVNGVLVPPPTRQPPPGVPAGWQQLLLDTEHGIEAATGMYGASIGGPSRERSGVALAGQKEQGEIGSFHYSDNLARSIRYTGRILAQWIPLVHDTKRKVPTMDVENEPGTAHIDPDQEHPVMEQPSTTRIGQTEKTYNLSAGTYDVISDDGPSFLSSREEAANFAMELTRADPTLMAKAGDKILRLYDVPEMRTIADRLAMFLPPNVQQAEASQSKMDPAAAAMMAQAQEAMQAVQAHAQQLAQAEEQLKTKAAQVGADQDQLAAERDKLAAERRILAAEVRAAKAEIEVAAMKVAQNLQAQTQPADETPLTDQAPNAAAG